LGSACTRSQGSERAFSLPHPQALKTLVQIARIQSVESSNAIEDVAAPHARVAWLVEDKSTPENRSEAEIAGYRSVLDAVHASAQQIPFKPSVVEQLHRDLYQFTGVPAGRWKTVENSVEEFAPTEPGSCASEPCPPPRRRPRWRSCTTASTERRARASTTRSCSRAATSSTSSQSAPSETATVESVGC
jgi:hypothetical protein